MTPSPSPSRMSCSSHPCGHTRVPLSFSSSLFMPSLLTLSVFSPLSLFHLPLCTISPFSLPPHPSIHPSYAFLYHSFYSFSSQETPRQYKTSVRHLMKSFITSITYSTHPYHNSICYLNTNYPSIHKIYKIYILKYIRTQTHTHTHTHGGVCRCMHT